MRILAVSGSLRQASYNTALLRAAQELAPGGVELALFEGLAEIPAYDDDRHQLPPPSVRHLRHAVEQADAVLIATPEYNSSIPGHLKNALDWLSRPLATSPLRNKPCAVAGASTGAFGAVWAQAETRKVLSAIGARVLDRELPVPAADQSFVDGRLTDARIEELLAELIEELVEAVHDRQRSRAAT
jgi:chromate reductase, NAD(P)H dehydrogenase (quinone)